MNPMNRGTARLISCLLLATSIAQCSSSTSKDIEPYQRPEHVILISIDTLRSDFLGIYNEATTTTPNIDAFARESLVFEDTLAPAPTTARSHKSIFYSVYPCVHKTSMNSIPRETLTSPIEVLRDAGYITAAFVGGGAISAQFGFDRGFDTYFESDRTSRMDKREIELLQEQIVSWLDLHSDERFFLFLHTYQVHCPYDPPEPFAQKHASWYEGEIDPRQKCSLNFYNDYPMAADDYRFVRDLYAGEVEYVDRFFGELLDKLRDLEIYEETLIIFVSDHGESLGERDRIGHGELYGEDLRIPLIIRIPGLGPARISNPVAAMDIMPTVYEVLGLSPPYAFQGQSLIPSVIRPEKVREGRIRISEKKATAAVHRWPWKLIFHSSRSGKEELYNLSRDPDETEDVSLDHERIVTDLKRAYRSMMKDGKAISDCFIVDKDDAEPDLDEKAIQSLKALGYVE